MKLDEMRLCDVLDLANLLEGKESSSLKIGTAYFVRTVTYHYTGRLVAITASDIMLDEAATIFDSGRWAEALKTGALSEVEPHPSVVIISRRAFVDATPWPHPLPREVK